jgi:hypothetical protein
MCRIRDRPEWGGRVDAILPTAGALIALVILLIILVAWIAEEAVM